MHQPPPRSTRHARQHERSALAASPLPPRRWTRRGDRGDRRGRAGSAGEVGDDGAAEILAGLELVEDRAQVGERTGARHVALAPCPGGEIDQLAHVLHGADRGVDERRVLQEELERVELEVALAGRRKADGDEQPGLAQQLQSEAEAGQRAENTSAASTPPSSRCTTSSASSGRPPTRRRASGRTRAAPPRCRRRRPGSRTPWRAARRSGRDLRRRRSPRPLRPGSTPCVSSFLTAP